MSDMQRPRRTLHSTCREARSICSADAIRAIQSVSKPPNVLATRDPNRQARSGNRAKEGPSLVSQAFCVPNLQCDPARWKVASTLSIFHPCAPHARHQPTRRSHGKSAYRPSLLVLARFIEG